MNDGIYGIPNRPTEYLLVHIYVYMLKIELINSYYTISFFIKLILLYYLLLFVALWCVHVCGFLHFACGYVCVCACVRMWVREWDSFHYHQFNEIIAYIHYIQYSLNLLSRYMCVCVLYVGYDDDDDAKWFVFFSPALFLSNFSFFARVHASKRASARAKIVIWIIRSFGLNFFFSF